LSTACKHSFKKDGKYSSSSSKIEITIYDLAIKIKKLLKSNVNVIFLYDKKDEIKRRKPDISKAKELLNWYPKYSLEEGLEKTIKFFKERLK